MAAGPGHRADHPARPVNQEWRAAKTERVSARSIADTKNEKATYTIVEAGSHEPAARMFEKRGLPRSRNRGCGLGKPLLLGVVAVLIPAALVLETVVLFWTFPLSSFVAVLIGVAFAAMLASQPSRFIALCALPSLAAALLLLFVPLSDLGYGPALSRFIALNIAVFLLTVGVIRWKQGVQKS